MLILNAKLKYDKVNKYNSIHVINLKYFLWQAHKDQCNPVFEETFEYVLGIAELNSKQLEVTVLTKKTWHSPVLGQIVLNLSDYVNQNSTNFTGWFDLQQEAKEVA